MIYLSMTKYDLGTSLEIGSIKSLELNCYLKFVNWHFLSGTKYSCVIHHKTVHFLFVCNHTMQLSSLPPPFQLPV